MIIHYITPFSTNLNIGKEYNDRISELPDDCYICLRDGDTMFLQSNWGKIIKTIIESNPEYDLLTCMTNRLGNPFHTVANMFDEDSITKHIAVANQMHEFWKTKVIDCDVAPGMLMIFKKSLWSKIKFVENSYYFDKLFSKSVLATGGKIGIAKGLYLLHLYRYGQKDPKEYKMHLKK